MIYEMRTYQVQPGKAAEFLKLYQEQGLHIISRYAKLIGCWTKESGVLNSVVFVWAYDDLGHRGIQRAKLGQDARVGCFRAVDVAVPGASGKRFSQPHRVLAAEVAVVPAALGGLAVSVAAGCKFGHCGPSKKL